jgi:hypothetical protein
MKFQINFHSAEGQLIGLPVRTNMQVGYDFGNADPCGCKVKKAEDDMNCEKIPQWGHWDEYNQCLTTAKSGLVNCFLHCHK